MSADHARPRPGHGHHDHDDDDDLGYHATVRGYVIGFVLSVVLTAIPFWLVMAEVLPTSGTDRLRDPRPSRRCRSSSTWSISCT